MKFIKRLLYNQLLTFRYLIGKTKTYHSGKRKSRLRLLKDLLAWQIKEGEFNTMYYAMGLNLAGSEQREYIGRKSFLKIKDRVEKKLKQRAGCGELNYDIISKDKFYANSIFKANGIPCLQNFALISSSSIIFSDGRIEKTESLLNLKDTFFLKNIVLEAGEGVFQCRIINGKIQVNGIIKDWSAFKTILGSNIWVVQTHHVSHESLRKFNPSALNTTRIVTILNGREPEFLCGFQGFATGNSVIDSWSNGSIYVGIDIKRGCLTEYGLTSVSDQRPGLLTVHPDSGIRFEGYEIPFLREAVNLCVSGHRLLYFNFIIGWDVAITDSGPLIVEANEKPGMNVAQALNGGLRYKIMERAKRILVALLLVVIQ